MQLSEEGLTKVALTVAGGSIAIVLLLLFFGVNVAEVSGGDYKHAFSPFAIKCWLFSFGYAVAFWSLSTLPKRSRQWRLASWLYANCVQLLRARVCLHERLG